MGVKLGIFQKRIPIFVETINKIIMENKPSFNGIGSSKKITLRTTPNKPEIKKQETTVSTQRPTTTIPSPRGHA